MITKYEIREICKITGLKPYQQEKYVWTQGELGVKTHQIMGSMRICYCYFLLKIVDTRIGCLSPGHQ